MALTRRWIYHLFAVFIQEKALIYFIIIHFIFVWIFKVKIVPLKKGLSNMLTTKGPGSEWNPAPSLFRNGSRSGSLKLKKKRIGTRHPDPAGSGTGSATLILTIDIRQKDRSESETI